MKTFKSHTGQVHAVYADISERTGRTIYTLGCNSNKSTGNGKVRGYEVDAEVTCKTCKKHIESGRFSIEAAA